jgi:acyl-coenzyme A thioesterase PaaI-like protein
MLEDSFMQDKIPREHPIRQCFGCGADNPLGLRIKSHMEGNEAICVWKPEIQHCAYPGYLNGGVACTLIDCHSAWAAFASYCADNGVDIESGGALPSGWTKAIEVEFLNPAPLDKEVTLRAKVVEKGKTSRTVECSLYSEDLECVRGRVVMVMK